VIDLRSDTVTQPTLAMRAAIAKAAVGDEQRREDPTVLDLERRAAELLGQEDAVFVPTATMANQIALKLLSRPGDVLIAERHSHVVVYEYGGPAVHAGLMVLGLAGTAGRLTPEQLTNAVPARTKAADQAPTLVSLENTHNNAGGRVWPLDELRAVVTTARELGLAVHLDGARVLNAAIALGCTPAEIGAQADSVTICLSKGLGCPLGALLASSAALVERARVEKHVFGGAMRQAGIVAAAGVYALDHHVERLAEDHARATRLADGLASAGLPIDLDQVETNFVQIDVAELALGRADALAQLRESGLGLSATIHPTVIRAVTHLGIGDEDIEQAIEIAASVLVGATAKT
jgi:threonine aldolase